MPLGLEKPKGPLKALARLPISFYRHRLGWVFGHKLLLLTHRGRKTGRPRQTVLIVYRYDRATRKSTVLLNWPGADWYKNVQVHPALQVQTARERYRPAQHFLTTDEIYTFLTGWHRRHPLIMRLVVRYLGFSYDGTDAGRRKLAEELRMVAFWPQTLLRPSPASE